MAHVLFCHNAADRLQAAANWLEQTYLSGTMDGQQIVIYAPERPLAERLNHLLWSTPPTGFLPHCLAQSPLAAETPLVIATTAEEVGRMAQTERLLNLSDEFPPGFERFAQLIEIVSQEASVRQPARERARHYRDQGHDLEYRDLLQTPLSMTVP